MDYGKALKKLRTDAGMTQQTVARLVNVTAQAISKWENGVNQPDIAMLQKLCAVFSVSVDDFLALADDGENTEPVSDSEPAAAPAQPSPIPAEENPVAAAKKRPRDYPWYFVAGALALVILSFILTAILVFGTGRTLNAQQIYNKVNPSVFYIEVETDSGRKSGSGFFIDNRGTAVTNYHVIKDGLNAVAVTADGERYQVEKVLGASESRDLAVIKIDVRRSRKVSLAYKVRTGETVYTIGYPEGFLIGTADSTFTNGIVSKASYLLNGNEYIQTNADITYGNSGGVLINSKGQVVGVTTGQLNVGGASYMNLAIPVYAIKTVERDVNMTLEEMFSKEPPPPPTPEYTVTFYNGSQQVGTRTVKEGNTVSAISVTAEGYNFDGWFANKNCTEPFDFTAPITGNTSVYAKFTPITYYIAYNANGGSGKMSRVAVKYDKSYRLPSCEFTYTRFQFSHWQATIGGVQKSFQALETVKNLTSKEGEEIVLTAIWEPWKYTLHFDTAGGGSLSSVTLTVGQSYSLPTPTRYGYTFVHWKYNGETFQAGQRVSDLDSTFTVPQITLTAEWTPITFTARYHSVGIWDGVEGETREETVAFGDPAPNGEKFFKKEGYTFKEWDYEYSPHVVYNLIAGQENKATGTQGATVDFYCDWSPIEYFVEWDYEGNGIVNRTEKVKYDESFYVWDSYVTLPEGQTVDYWLLKTSAGVETEYKDGTRLKGVESVAGAHCRLTAVWRPLRYEIIYVHPDHGARDFIEYVSWGEKYTVRGGEVLSRAGYTVMGWSDKSYSDEIVYGIGQEVENLSNREGGIVWMYGIWRAHTYTVEFSAPEADSGQMPPQEFTYGEWQALTLNTFARAGYYLVGWQLGEQLFHDGEEVQNLTAEDGGTVTLAAVWAAALEGEGTAEHPFLVSDWEELNKMSYYVSYVAGGAAAHYALTADIDAAQASFTPIGSLEAVFKGTLDGRGHIIKNIVFMQASAPDDKCSYAGLFACVEGGTVRNLGIENYSVDIVQPDTLEYYHYSYFVGPLAGQMIGDSTVEQVFATGDISLVGGSKGVYVGGLVGRFAGTMSESYASGIATVSAQGGSTGGQLTTNTMRVGGLVGHVPAPGNTAFSHCYANVNISASLTGRSTQINDYLGGFLGFAEDSCAVRFTSCFAMGDVTYSRDTATGIGRFVGEAKNVTFRSVYVNAEARLLPSGENPTGVREAYTDNFTNFGWIKENLSFSEDIWTVEQGGLPTLKQFEEGRA